MLRLSLSPSLSIDWSAWGIRMRKRNRDILQFDRQSLQVIAPNSKSDLRKFFFIISRRYYNEVIFIFSFSEPSGKRKTCWRVMPFPSP